MYTHANAHILHLHIHICMYTHTVCKKLLFFIRHTIYVYVFFLYNVLM